MKFHWKGVLALLALLVVSFIAAQMTGSREIGLGVLLVGAMAGFVIAVAWMRPRRPHRPHHHHHEPGDAQGPQ